ncbi:MAG: hypothetical protein V3W20_08810, partial [Candidatus Neomarinimicrobiota bacterium]
MNKITDNLIRNWQKGNLYAFFAIILFLFYALNGNVGVMDWFKDSAYLHYIKTALTEFDTLPYFWWNKIDEISWIPPVKATSVFISIPETTLFSPLTPLLYILSEIVYLKFYVLVQCLVGLSGVFALRKQLQWNDIQFRTYLVLFLFSPIVFQHIAVGYFPWYNIFFFPWLIYFLAETKSFTKVMGMSAVLALVLLQGGVYVFVWFVMLLFLYGFYNMAIERTYMTILQIIGATVLVFLLAHVRIYTASLAFADFSREWFETNGYNPLNFLFFALVPTITIQPLDLLFWTNLIRIGILPHDAGIFWGLVILMVIVMVFRFKEIFKEDTKSQNIINYKAIFFAAVTIFIFSFFSVWATIMRTIQLLVDLPFFESIKNYGYRLGIPAYLGFSLVTANHVERIWIVVLRIARRKPWLIFKKLAKMLFNISLIGLGSTYFGMIIFKYAILNQLHDVISKAYNNTGHFWLHKRMEGILENNLTFYFSRLEGLYVTVHNIILDIFVVFVIVYIITLIIKINKDSINKINAKFPFIKLELALVLPLMFSTFMWVQLATRTPYDSHPKQNVAPPEVVVISKQSNALPLMKATPQKLIITQINNANVGGYLFPNIKAVEYKNLKITSRNGYLYNSKNRLMVKPLDNQPIIIEFTTEKIKQAIWITIL